MATTLKISGKTVFIDQADLDTIKEFSDNSICLFKGSAHDAFYPAIQTTKKGKRSTLLLGRISTKNTDRLRMGYEEAKALTIENGFLTEADWLYIDSLILIEEL
jgi:hypothetical protein